jgi:subtilisin family serine protease
MVLCLFGGARVSEASDPERYIVKFRDDRAAQRLGKSERRGAPVLRELARHRAAVMMLDATQAADMARDPAVEAIERDARRYPTGLLRAPPSAADLLPSAGTGSQQTIPYGLPLVQALGLKGNRAAGIKVCVIDSGYDMGHEDKPRRTTVTGINDPGGTGPWYRDGDGHGTHVSGTINSFNNSVGIRGIFPRVSMHIVRVFGDKGEWAYSSDLVAALDACIAAGADVVNMSLGGSDPTELERIAFRNARWAGVLAVAAAGNDGQAVFSFPASYPSVMSVGAVDDTSRHASFSNRNKEVDIAAPGVSVLSTVPRGNVREAFIESPLGETSVVPMDNFAVPVDPLSGALVDCGLAGSAAECGDATGAMCLIERGTFFFYEKARSCAAAGGIGAVVFNKEGEVGPVYGTLGEERSSIPIVGTDRATGISLRALHLGRTVTLSFGTRSPDYDSYSGTSMATPHVAGVAALIWSRHPKCSNDQVRRAMEQTALDLGNSGRDWMYGAGLVQARAADDYLLSQPPPCGGS